MLEAFHQKPNLYIKEVSIHVSDLDTSLLFYKDFMGLKILTQHNNEVLLSADEKTPILRLIQPSNVKRKQRRTTGLYHFALLLPSRTDLAMFLKHLQTNNYTYGAADHLVSEAIYLDDPDGNGIEVYADRPFEQWTWDLQKVEMATEPLHVDELLNLTDHSWNGMPRKTVMGHIHLHVQELEKTEQFYTEGLGYDVVANYPGAIFMSTGKYHHHIAVNVWNGLGAPIPAENSVGLQSFSIVFEHEAKRKEVVNRLQSLQFPVSNVNGDYIALDPSGNKIYLVC